LKIRRQARSVALQSLFEIDSVGHNQEEVIRRRIDDEGLTDDGAQFAASLVHGVEEYRQQLDLIIGKYAPEWPVDQLAIVDRNILRMALYELQHVGDVPIKVAVNEAVELAKVFGSDTAPRFINGVLGAFLVEHPAAELRKS
jgi:N utilization substance protein B